MNSLGPIPISYVLLLIAYLIASGVGRWLGKSQGMSSVLGDIFIAGMLGARLVFVAIWYDLYPTFWAMLDIRDGGFNGWGALVAALLYALWRVRKNVALRKPLAWSLLAGAVVWGGLTEALHRIESIQLPAISLQTMQGQATTLASLADGQLLVLNLWASWCPPCRREMPVLQAAQKAEGDIRFVFANQGEGPRTVEQYLKIHQLNLSNVLLDPPSKLAKEMGSVAFPTTFFFSADGRLVDTHVGELSAASLAHKLKLIRNDSALQTKPKS
jgi:thiol-disulfide isomerase/thioredoxin